MIRRHIIMSAALAAFALSSCSGGDDSNPAPTPTPSPSPTPTPSPTYVALPLSTATQFTTTFNAGTSYTGDPAAGAVTLGVVATEMATSRVNLALDSVLATGTYVFHENTEESRFVNANLITAPSPAVTEYVFRTTDAATAGKFSQVEFLNNTIPPQTTGGPSVVTSDATLALTRLSYGNWWRGDSTAGQKRLTYTIFGYPTVLTDMPTTGTVNYNTRVVGRLVSVAGGATTISRVSGTVTTSVNFSTGLVDTTLTLTTLDAGGAATPYITLTAQGGILAGQNQFSGSLTNGGPLSGTIAGGFFGSQGEQIGIVFAASGTVGGANQRLIGEIVGKK
ncbi:hypothetical protein IAG41_21485 [Sphingomonas sp. JC676]|uniref:transferrin-binding protein-like solute binding protein n=1 Tax=Sphingomonas sp. JC676 TaxID=2768065 RepID=UPI001658315E|nr:transferrin-binding protein-like solute binding protein [Sphingomonas sp. JC676]MBC9034973.1 hypothetical protein [Sphingomonas sp. JC676]